MVKNTAVYRSFACSAAGAHHVKNDTPSQDYTVRYKSANLHIIAAADGHGSEAHFLSGRGARFACKCAVKRLKDFVLQGDQEDAFGKLASAIAADWKKCVINDWNNYREELPENPGCDGEIWSAAFDDPLRAYGTTLIAAVLLVPASKNKGRCFGLQIGDGKCVVIDKHGKVTQPIPWDDRCCLNATTSLCDGNAAEEFRYFYSPAGDALPAAIFIGTDGVDGAYPVYKNEKHLSALYQTIYGNFIKEGFDEGEKQLKEFLPEFSAKGSGDDVSIAGIIKI
jgi:hypothetical protein